MKYDAIISSGIEVVNRISIPDELIPKDAQVEMEAKKAAGYFNTEKPKSKADLKKVKGRDTARALSKFKNLSARSRGLAGKRLVFLQFFLFYPIPLLFLKVCLYRKRVELKYAVKIGWRFRSMVRLWVLRPSRS